MDRKEICSMNVKTYMIAHMDWIGLGPKFIGLDWSGLRKLDPCPTLGRTPSGIRIWCIIALKSDSWWHNFCDRARAGFIRTDLNNLEIRYKLFMYFPALLVHVYATASKPQWVLFCFDSFLFVIPIFCCCFYPFFSVPYINVTVDVQPCSHLL